MWLFQYFAPAYSSPDASGYYLPARLLATEGHSWVRPESPVEYLNVHFMETPDGRYFGRYPPGLPVLAAAVRVTAGPPAAIALDLVLASVLVFATFLLAAPLVGAPFALLAAVAVAVHPAANLHALAAESHTPAALVLVLGFVALDRWAERASGLMALLAGLLLGSLPAFRYAEAVCAMNRPATRQARLAMGVALHQPARHRPIRPGQARRRWQRVIRLFPSLDR